MTVYVLFLGEFSEGASIVGIYSTMEKAKEVAVKYPCVFEEGWNQISETEWEAGCDYLSIKEYEVE